jgi:ribosomal protein S1
MIEQNTPIEDFNWDVPNGFTVNQKVRTKDGSKVYCHEPYAQDVYDKMFDFMGDKAYTKDLITGNSYECEILRSNDEYCIAQTDSGQSIYIDLAKEIKDAKRLGISGLDFSVGTKVNTTVRNVMGTYYGSVVDGFINDMKIEFFEQIHKESLAYEARIKSVNKGGYLVDVQGIECFLPGSLAAANKITDFDSYVGKVIYVMIDGYVQHKGIFVVSYKKYLEKIMDQKIQELDLTKKYKGYVTGTSKFGVFVEWEDIYTGLIHKTEFENHVVEGFRAGDEIEFYVKEVKDDNRLTLTFGGPLEKTVRVYDLKKDVDDGTHEPVKAIIKHKRKNGALIEIPELDLMAMIPQGRMTRDHKGLKSGDSVLVEIYEVDAVMGKIFAKPLDE